jgi:hypothetical protein
MAMTGLPYGTQTLVFVTLISSSLRKKYGYRRMLVKSLPWIGYIVVGIAVIEWPGVVIREGLIYPALYPVVAWSLCGLLMVGLHRQHSLQRKLQRQRVEAGSTQQGQQGREVTGKFTPTMEASALTIPMEMLRLQSSFPMMVETGRHGQLTHQELITGSAELPIYEQLVKEVTGG